MRTEQPAQTPPATSYREEIDGKLIKRPKLTTASDLIS